MKVKYNQNAYVYLSIFFSLDSFESESNKKYRSTFLFIENVAYTAHTKEPKIANE